MKNILLLLLLLPVFGRSQNVGSDTALVNTADTLKSDLLTEVIVKAFEQNRRLQDVPAAVAYISNASLNRYSNTTVLPAFNAVPGVRMEERSPGSYRLNIRGSSVRSPFGVRNVKIYLNNIPLTDAGGTTYLNQLGFSNFQSVEVIKGPGSSLYGLGTGGVVLIESTPEKWSQGFGLNYTSGSYGLSNVSATVRFGDAAFQNTITYQHQTSDGYRQHSALRRDVFLWNATAKGQNHELTTTFLYGDLMYETPGPLTLTEYTNTPKASRPRVGATPGSVESHATIFQKTALAGFTYKMYMGKHWQHTTTLYGALTQLRNPTIRNYERRSEPHTGGRTVLQYKRDVNNSHILWHVGAELQQNFNTIAVYKNKGGNPDSLQTDDELLLRQGFIFSQLSWQLKDWLFTAGVSLNQLRVKSTRFSVSPILRQERSYNNELAPRISILKKINRFVSVYNNVAKGFSPPSTGEVLPSTGVLNTSLNAEQGLNYEVGAKGVLLNSRLTFDVNAFFFRLKNTIVQRRDATGGDYFINAGSTRQNGVESSMGYQLSKGKNFLDRKSRLWASYTYNQFKYQAFKQLDVDFSGNTLPGSTPHNVAAGLDLFLKKHFYLQLTYFYSDRVALNDANTAYAGSYNLATGRVGYQAMLKQKLHLELYCGADNLFDTKYSLGNDINGFGGRFYNAAAGRNYFAGISLSLDQQK